MNTIGTKTIETERLILRRYRVEDAEDMFRNWASVPEVTKFLSWPTHTSVDFTRKLLTDWVSFYEDGKTYNWGITLKGDDRVIGNIAVVERDERTCSYEVGYCLGNAYWGRGIMPEALRAVIRYLFEGESDLQRVYATHDLRNTKSGRVMQKAGMHFDGILRGSKKNMQGIHDTAYYSVLRSDLVTREQYEALFMEMNPDFFERDYVKRVPDDESASEMLLRLQEFDPKCYRKDLPGNVTFGFYDGDLEELRAAVATVVEHWPQFFSENSRIYCGFVDGNVASFCMIEDFGEHEVDGMKWKIGGPGCVGTVPAYRDRGIGLTMVRNVTQILREEFYDYSYIHYTYETAWYGKLGYRTVLQWNGKGFVRKRSFRKIMGQWLHRCQEETVMKILKTTLARGHMMFGLADGRYVFVQGEMTLGMKFYADKGFDWYWIEEPKGEVYFSSDTDIIAQVTDEEKEELAAAIAEYYRDKEFQVIVD